VAPLMSGRPWPLIRAAPIAVSILDQHFPESLHLDILNAVSLALDTITGKK
jgi:hypothetical protein